MHNDMRARAQTHVMCMHMSTGGVHVFNWACFFAYSDAALHIQLLQANVVMSAFFRQGPRPYINCIINATPSNMQLCNYNDRTS